MGKLEIFTRSGDIQRFEDGLKKAKHGIMEVCEIWENMKKEFSETSGSYEERYSPHHEGSGHYGGQHPFMSERDWHELQERRSRDAMGRYK